MKILLSKIELFQFLNYYLIDNNQLSRNNLLLKLIYCFVLIKGNILFVYYKNGMFLLFKYK